MATLALGAFAASLFSTSCSLVLKTDSEQCVKDEDCAALGPDFAGTTCLDQVCQTPPDPAWACVGHVAEPSATAMFSSSILVYDLLSGKPSTNATVKLCRQFDPPCAAPVMTVPIAADGTVSTSVAASFKGFYFIETPDEHIPTLFTINTFRDPEKTTVVLLTQAASDALNSAFNPKPAPGSGSVSISMQDCTHKDASGVHFDIETVGTKIPFYTTGGVVSPTATQTDVGGGGGFAGLEEGSITVTATLVKTNRIVAKISGQVRAGSLTYMPVSPTPLD